MLALPVRRSLLCSAMALAAFGGVALAVTRVPAVSALDETIAQRLNQVANDSPASVDCFRWITALGTTPFLIWLSLAVIGLLLFKGHWQLASAWVISLLLVALIIQRTKLAFGRTRPVFNGEFAREDSLSFPSGHALASMVVFGMLAYLLTLATSDARFRRAAIGFAAILIVLIGFSRIYLGVHFTSDVVAGYLLGAAWLAFCVALIEDARQHYSASRTAAGQ